MIFNDSTLVPVNGKGEDVKIVKIGKSRQVLTTGNHDRQANLGKSRQVLSSL